MFYVTVLLSSFNLTSPYIEFAYRSASLSILETLGYNEENDDHVLNHELEELTGTDSVH
jgi:hypothetical protein